MTELLTAAQMRAVEEAAMASGEVTGLELMERAGRGVVEAVFEEWPDLAATSHRAVVLCGPGNNGGDGFVVARLLRDRGWDVELFLFGDPEKLPPDARVNYERWAQMGAVGDMIRGVGQGRAPQLLVDAVFGTGLSRPVEGKLAQVLAAFDGFRDLKAGRTVAVDIPSGLCADSGRALGACARADLTVTFHAAKPGHHLSRGPHQSGKLKVKDIGLEPGAGADGAVRLVERPCSGHLEKRAERHKYGHGHALVLSGGAGRTGAARLAARGALRIGAGLVTLGVPPSALMEAACQVTSIMLARVEGGDGLADVLQDERLSAVCLGPGLGVERARELVPVALGRGGVEPRPTVLDADALTAFAEAPDELFEMLHAACVLTPHGGEFARLFPDIAERLDATPMAGPACSKVDATRDAAARAGCVVLFKGADTVIAAPDGRCSINSAQYDRAAPWLATAGAGDVLAGFIAGLLARGVEPMQAAEAAAWLHVDCARSFGPGLIAEDLPEELPRVLRDGAG
ncbi:NAD(P)H-hydrate dehydratase [Roseovarius atlanticus]|uniref:NAD(P)H-hydrate dehydratase n=1 Tax=Roseovarius atlanticus TaxID=1641875 RepID=UPI001C93E07D|nr:NAD(P)H-hydrate dehydratase [Roseovarius atlanticus]MBY5988376.1 NAD(P)H-hydrate dehydratase [Roseovarius atlanticus]MBY6123767.1 NAD(P)H-hydrate dehydratase [Roseovarius atlanticus]MBY6148262.1 NAD(P)H-hydrate dehydratase [Roseovarius atlanticus]